EEVIRVGHVLVDGALDQAKAERPGVEVQVLLGIPADGRDVMDAVDGAHDEVPCLIIPGASAPGYPPALVCTGPFVYDLPAGLKGDPMPSILRRAAVFALLALPALAAFAQPAGSSSPRALPGLDLSALDRSVQPCDDFYQFACGGWMAKNPVPPDRSRWGSFEELAIRNRSVMRDVLEKAAKPEPARDRIDQKIGDYYASCMDEAGIEAKGAAPLEPQLHRIAALQTRDEVAAVLARLHAEGVPALFRFTSQPDFKNAVLNIAVVDQGGLALPDRDYYLSDEARFTDIRKHYLVHVQKMFELMGEPQDAAVKDAQTVLDVETALAKQSLDRVSRRDPAKRYHPMKREQLAALAPSLDWNAYFTAAESPAFTEVNVGWPDFFAGVNELLAAKSLDDWKTYFRWQAVHEAAPFLAAAFVNEDFDFFERTLRGSKELRPRWERCVEHTDRQLGEALGQRYVEAAFGPESRARTSKMVVALEAALQRDIRELPWMTETTKKRALEKLAAIANKIGYPEHWRDYSKLSVVRGDALGNLQRAAAFEAARQRAKIGRKVDPSEWTMTPP